jgi:hypothetical protein
MLGSSDPNVGVLGGSGSGTGVFGSSGSCFGGEFVGTPSNNGSSGSLRLSGNVVKFNGEYSEALPHPDGSQRLLYVPLSPESWYEDFGRAELVEGRGRVEFDPDFAAILSIDDGDYHVFLTPEGDSNGLYVSSRSPTAFEVHEQQGGTSSLTFSYRVVVANKRKYAQAERLAKVEEPQSMPEPSPEPRPQPGSPAARGFDLARLEEEQERLRQMMRQRPPQPPPPQFAPPPQPSMVPPRSFDFARLEEEQRRQIDELRRLVEEQRRQMEELRRRVGPQEEAPPEST